MPRKLANTPDIRVDFTKPSQLPALLLAEYRIGLLSQAEEVLLNNYGIDAEFRSVLREMPLGFWRDIAAASEGVSMEEWQIRQKHHYDVMATHDKLGHLVNGVIRRFDGKKFFPAIKELGHTAGELEKCECWTKRPQVNQPAPRFSTKR